MTEENKTTMNDLVKGKKYNITLLVHSSNEWKEARNKSAYCVLYAYDLTYNPYKQAPITTIVIFHKGNYDNIEFVPGQLIILKEATYNYFEGSYSLQVNITNRKKSLVIKTSSIGSERFVNLFNAKSKTYLRTRLNFNKEIVQCEIFSTYLSTFCKEITADVEYRLLNELTYKHLFQSISLIGEFYTEIDEPLYFNYPEFMLKESINYTTLLFKATTSSDLNFLPKTIQNNEKNIFPVLIPYPNNIIKYKESALKIKFSNLLLFIDMKHMSFGFLYTNFSSHRLENENKMITQPELITNYDICKHNKSFGEDSEFLLCNDRTLNKLIKLGYDKFIPLKFCLNNITVFQDYYVKCKIIDIIPCSSIDIIIDFCKICKVARNGEYNDDIKKLECKICKQGEFLYTTFFVIVIADSTESTPALLKDKFIKEFLRINECSPYNEIRTKVQNFIDMIKKTSTTIIARIDFVDRLLSVRQILHFETP